MSYYVSKMVEGNFDEVVGRATDSLKEQGFGVLTEIDVDQVLKKKLDVDFRRYKILGACNPHFAYQALQSEDKVGTMLPCNVIIRQTEEGQVEAAAVDPLASMQAIKNQSLEEIAIEVKEKLTRVITQL